MIGGNLPALTEVLRLLVPTTELLNRYHESLYCSIGGLAVMANSPPAISIRRGGVCRPDARYRTLSLSE